jgi:hypothetical protein
MENKGLKYDGIKEGTPKNRWDLLPFKEIEGIVEILTFGSVKYGDNNWQLLENGKERYFSAAMRHLSAWRQGELIDPESGKPHLHHAECNLIFLAYIERMSVDITKLNI